YFARICIVVAWCAVAPGSALAQLGTGEIAGRLADQAGAPVPGAGVTVINLETSRRYSVVSGAGGLYTAAGLLPGRYRIEVQLAGFKSVARDGIRVATGERVLVD